MRRAAALLLLPVLASAALSGCGGGKPPAPSQPVVSGAFGTPPVVKFPAGTPNAITSFTTVIAGTGAPRKETDLTVGNIALYVWDGKQNADRASSFATGIPTDLSGLQRGLPKIDQLLKGEKPGSRVLGVVAAKDAFPTGQYPSGFTKDDAVVYVADILANYGGAAMTTAATASQGKGALPAVTGAAGQPPTVAIPAGKAPTSLAVEPVIQGTGPVVKKGQLIVVHYLGYIWNTRKKFDASWDRGLPFATAIGEKQVVTGWDQGLVGQRVGSRVLLVIPPSLGYGAQGSGQIKGTDTMVFVVDIIDAKGAGK